MAGARRSGDPGGPDPAEAEGLSERIDQLELELKYLRAGLRPVYDNPKRDNDVE